MVSRASIRILRKLVEVQVILIFSLVLFGRKVSEFVSTVVQNQTLESLIGAAICIGFVTVIVRSPDRAFVKFFKIAISLLIVLGTGTLLVAAEEALHLLLYGALCLTTARLYIEEEASKPLLRAFLFAIFVGFLDEALQGFHPERVFDLRDLTLNAVGAFLGFVASPFSPNYSLKKPLI